MSCGREDGLKRAPATVAGAGGTEVVASPEGVALLEKIAAHKEGARVLAAARLCEKLHEQDPCLYRRHASLVESIAQEVRVLSGVERMLHIPFGFPCLRVGDRVSVFSCDAAGHTGAPGGTPGHALAFLFDSLLDAPMYFMCAVLKEVGLYKQWNPLLRDVFCTSGPVFGRTGWRRFTLWWLMQSPLPMMVDNRDACVQATVYDCLDEKTPCVVVLIKDKTDAPVPKGCNADTVRMSVGTVVLRLQHAGPNSVRVSGFVAVDMHLRFTPLFMQRQAAASAVCDVVDAWEAQAKLAQQAHKSGNRVRNAHVAAAENDEEFYTMLRERLQGLEQA